MSVKIYERIQDRGKLYEIWEAVGTHWFAEPEGLSSSYEWGERKLHVAPSRRIEGGVFLSIGGKSAHLTAEQLDDIATILAFIKKVNEDYDEL